MLNLIANEWHPLLTGLWNTILCSLIALIGSLIIGTFFALLEISQHRVVKIIGHVYVEVFRNIPLLVITMAFFLIIPMYIVKINGLLKLSVPELTQLTTDKWREHSLMA